MFLLQSFWLCLKLVLRTRSPEWVTEGTANHVGKKRAAEPIISVKICYDEQRQGALEPVLRRWVNRPHISLCYLGWFNQTSILINGTTMVINSTRGFPILISARSHKRGGVCRVWPISKGIPCRLRISCFKCRQLLFKIYEEFKHITRPKTTLLLLLQQQEFQTLAMYKFVRLGLINNSLDQLSYSTLITLLQSKRVGQLLSLPLAYISSVWLLPTWIKLWADLD